VFSIETKQSPLVLDLCLRKTRAGKSHDYRDGRLKGVFQKFRFRNGLVCTVSLAVILRLSRSVESSENLHGDVKHAKLFECQKMCFPVSVQFNVRAS